MSMNDPIADYLTRIRNASRAKHSKVDIPASNLIKRMSQILLEEGYIQNFTVVDDELQGIVRIYLKYDENKKPAITGLKRISRPGFRQYKAADQIPRVLNGMGIAILSTSNGVMVDRKARKDHVGGEVLCYVW